MKQFKNVWHEPLLHFILIGAALFLLFAWTRTNDERAPNRIVVSESQLEQLTAQFKRTWLRPPTEAELTGLIDSFVRDEVYYREALAMGLDREDPMVRRRMRQKLEFILEDLSAVREPDDNTLKAFLHQHADRFQIEPGISFHQVYLNPDARPDLTTDAQTIINQLREGGDPTSLGDPTLVAFTFNSAPQSVVERSFGALFAQGVFKLAPGKWEGPIFSGMGAHLVLVTEKTQARMPELAEVRTQVEREYMAQHRLDMKEATYNKLLKGYEVVIETSADKSSTAASADTEKKAQ